MKQSIQLLHEILVGSSIHINFQIILEVHKKGGVERDSWSGLLGGRDPCAHREARRESGMLTTQDVSSTEETKLKYLHSSQKAGYLTRKPRMDFVNDLVTFLLSVRADLTHLLL